MENTLPPRFSGTLKEILMMATERGQQYVDMVKQKATKNNLRVNTDVIVSIRSIVKELVEYAEKKAIDMVVIRSRVYLDLKKCCWVA